MRRLNPTIRKMLEGLAYADLAEMLPPSAKDRCLDPEHALAGPAPAPARSPVPAGSAVVTGRRRVGLFLGPYATSAVIEYALESCGRLDAELVVFTFMDEARARRLLEGFGPQSLARAPALHIEHLAGKPERALGAMQERGMRLDFLVCDERGYLGHQILGGEIALEIPVVMVAPAQEPSRQPVSIVPIGAMHAQP